MQGGRLPNLKSIRAARKAAKREMRNKSVRTFVKSRMTKAESLIAAQDQDAAKEAVTKAVSALDIAARKGVIHPNNAARRKSRLMKKLNQAIKA
jgi:small subunit ribosomal protein S20